MRKTLTTSGALSGASRSPKCGVGGSVAPVGLGMLLAAALEVPEELEAPEVPSR